jgi:hypothetical protein
MRRAGYWVVTAVYCGVIMPAFAVVGLAGWTCVVLWHQAKEFYRDWREA